MLERVEKHYAGIFFLKGKYKEVNTKATTLTLYIKHDGDFSGAHTVGGAADVFSGVLAAHVGQH